MSFESIQKNKDTQIPISEGLSVLLNMNHIDMNKYIISNIPDFYDVKNILENNYCLNLICPICLNILMKPKCCSANTIPHAFCKNCIDIHLKNFQNCPICQKIFEYKNNNKIESLLNYVIFLKKDVMKLLMIQTT